jgi:beta-xylosidase
MVNPLSKNQYADPESRVYGYTVKMYVTNSLPFDDQLYLDLISRKDLENFDIYRDILDMSAYPGAKRAVWAPTIMDKDGKYYIIFAANDIHS